jgi:FRG domain-containing protein
MKGQWIGIYTGSSGGTMIVNIDESPSHYQGVAYLREGDQTLPGTASFFRTKDKTTPFQFRTTLIAALNPLTGLIDSWDTLKGHYPEVTAIADYADVEGSWDSTALSLSWTTNLGANGSCVLQGSDAEEPSELVPLTKTWDSYKQYVASLEGRRYLFRGQTKPWRLRTSFHRAGRSDLNRFLTEDIQHLHKHLSARTKHVFNLNIPNENGAFLNLVQHHGYPTPLLDWTYSPYVAAFFAYRTISNQDASKATADDKVRILVFDQERWRTEWTQSLQLAPAGLNLSIGEFLAIENERMIPQQAASLLTSVDDIESYISSKEGNGEKYLWAIDLPVRDRNPIVQELRYMGITAGAMFPGLDGACEELKERNFGI